MNRITILFLSGFFLAGCSGEKSTDAYGHFEAIETIISSEATGKLIYVDLAQGQSIRKDQHVATVDSTQPALQKQELLARRLSVQSRIASADAQISVVQQQLDNLALDLRRMQNMFEENAATQKQIDDLTGAEKILQKQLNAARAQRSAVLAERQALDANLALLNEQLRRCRIVNPIDGMVLEKYVEAYEMTTVGRPLYKIANLSELILRVYISGAQLSALKIGEKCTVRIDDDKKDKSYPGTITWISDTAEFTPKIIQTKEERINLVYAVKVRVKNDGAIKIGMPGEVTFNSI